jgi:hypothetical protein
MGQISGISEMPVDYVTDMAQCGDRVLLLGERRAQWRCLTLDLKSEVFSDVPLPIKGKPVLSPRTVPDSDPPSQVWIDAQDRLILAQGESTVMIPLEDWTPDLACQATPEGLVFFRCAGTPGRPELLLWHKGRLQHRKVGKREDQGYSPLLYREKEHLFALWISRPRQAICMQVFSKDLAPRQGVCELLKEGPLRTLYWISCFHAEDRGLVLAWQTGSGEENFMGDGASTAKHEYHFSLLDSWQGVLSEPIKLYGPAESLVVGGWAENSLIVVLGGAGHALVFHIRSTGLT